MKTNIEIEYKSLLDKSTYERLMKELNLENKTYSQTNFYFDNDNKDLSKEKIVLRIRKKDYNVKLTKKSTYNNNILEESIMLDYKDADLMVKDGFDASIININTYVKNIGTLNTLRAKCPYKDGMLFLDKNEYNGITDYELEFEASNEITGPTTFEELLKEFNIEFKKSKSKFLRCMETI